MSTVNHQSPVKIQGVTRGVVYCYLDHSDLSAAATTENITWAALVAAHPDGASNPPANARIVYAHAKLVEVFSGADVTAVVVSLGDAGSFNEQLNAINVFTGQALGLKAKSGTYAGTAIEAAYEPSIRVVTTDANVAALEEGTGAMEFALHYEVIDADRKVRIAG